MIGVLHPCSGCGHKTMDDCWKASSELTSRTRRLCVECHDDCLPRQRTARKKPVASRPTTVDPKDVHRLLFGPYTPG
jgi:hypothetical protein